MNGPSNQLEMPILVPLADAFVQVRPDPLDRGLLLQVRQQTGLSLNHIMRCCIQIAYIEGKFAGSYRFLLPAAPRAVSQRRHAGRRPRAVVMRELRESIVRNLRQLERDKRDLAALEAAEKARAA